MDIRQLHYFLVLCDEMNYSRAAQRLFLSRQALRQSISALEAELCGPLFLSAHHKLTLTDRGMSLQRHAAPVVEQFQQMQASLRAEIQSAQPVRIGISVSLVPDYLPGLETQLDKFRQQYPHVEMRFRMMDNEGGGGGGGGGGRGGGGGWAGGGPGGWPAPPCGQTLPACWCPGGTRSGIRRASRWQSCAVSGCCCPACGRICSARCGRPAPGWALRRMRRSAPAFIRPIILCRSSFAPV